MMDGLFEDTYDTSTHRLCGMCNEVKPLEEFYKDGKSPNGTPKYRRDCKSCYRDSRAHEQAMKRKKGAKKK